MKIFDITQEDSVNQHMNVLVYLCTVIAGIVGMKVHVNIMIQKVQMLS